MSEDRCELAKTAYQRLYLLEPDLTPDNVIIVGDTPNDILCAQAIKARSLAKAPALVLPVSRHVL